MKRWVTSLMDYKVFMLMYFAGGIFVYLLLDLIFLRTGSLSTITCLQILIAAILLAATHYSLVEEHIAPNLSHKKRIFIHLLMNYVLMLIFSVLCGWIPKFTIFNFALFTGVFAVIYLGLSIGFAVYYALLRYKLNDQLEKYKNV